MGENNKTLTGEAKQFKRAADIFFYTCAKLFGVVALMRRLGLKPKTDPRTKD